MDIPDKDLELLKQKIKTQNYIDREDLLTFLKLIPTNDATVIINETKSWLQTLHDDPDLPNVSFPQGDIDAVIGDLDSYGRVQPLTIQQFKQSSVKAPPQTS